MAKKIAADQRRQDDDEETLDETSALDTLKPGSQGSDSDPASRIEMLRATIGALASMSTEELTKLYDATVSQYGPGESYGVGDESEKNRSSVDAKASGAAGKGRWSSSEPMPKITAKEDVEAVFAGSDLSEEAQTRVTDLFEAAVAARLAVETVRLEEEFDARLTEEVEKGLTEIREGLDAYLDHVVETWMEENHLAVEQGLATDITTNFIEGLRDLFAESYIEVPDERLDVVEELSSRLEELESSLDVVIGENRRLEGLIDEAVRVAAIDEVSEGLTVDQAEKLETLVESIDFDGSDVESFKKRVATVRGAHFGGSVPDSKKPDLTEEADPSPATTEPGLAPTGDKQMRSYTDAISRSLKPHF